MRSHAALAAALRAVWVASVQLSTVKICPEGQAQVTAPGSASVQVATAEPTIAKQSALRKVMGDDSSLRVSQHWAIAAYFGPKNGVA